MQGVSTVIFKKRWNIINYPIFFVNLDALILLFYYTCQKSTYFILPNYIIYLTECVQKYKSYLLCSGCWYQLRMQQTTAFLSMSSHPLVHSTQCKPSACVILLCLFVSECQFLSFLLRESVILQEFPVPYLSTHPNYVIYFRISPYHFVLLPCAWLSLILAWMFHLLPVLLLLWSVAMILLQFVYMAATEYANLGCN